MHTSQGWYNADIIDTSPSPALYRIANPLHADMLKIFVGCQIVFTDVQKFDGREFRNLSSGEYIQMSGRAGRRGLDDRGVVLMMVNEKIEPSDARRMIKGEADRLDSAFHLGYNMIINLMKVEGISPEFMLERCFFQFQSSAGIPVLEDGTSRS